MLNTRSCLSPILRTVGLIALGASSLASQEFPATHASINGPSALAADNRGHLFVIDMNENKVQRIDLEKGTMSTVAGNGRKCCYKDGAKAIDVSLDFIRALAVDPQGNIFISDVDHNRKIDWRTGLISTVAGSEDSGNTLEGVSALSAQFWEIDGLAVDSQGDLFVADGHQSKIFKIDTATGNVHDYAGSGKFGFAGDGGPALEASFRFPDSISIDNSGNLLVADFENCRVRRVSRETGIITTIAVTDRPEESCSDIGNSRPGPFPSDPISDSAGNIYFDEGALDLVLRVDSVKSAVSTFAGNGKRGFGGDLGPAREAELAEPSGLAVDSDGNLYIAEYVNNRVRRVDARTGVITTIAGNGLPHRVDIQM